MKGIKKKTIWMFLAAFIVISAVLIIIICHDQPRFYEENTAFMSQGDFGPYDLSLRPDGRFRFYDILGSSSFSGGAGSYELRGKRLVLYFDEYPDRSARMVFRLDGERLVYSERESQGLDNIMARLHRRIEDQSIWIPSELFLDWND